MWLKKCDKGLTTRLCGLQLIYIEFVRKDQRNEFLVCMLTMVYSSTIRSSHGSEHIHGEQVYTFIGLSLYRFMSSLLDIGVGHTSDQNMSY